MAPMVDTSNQEEDYEPATHGSHITTGINPCFISAERNIYINISTTSYHVFSYMFIRDVTSMLEM